LGGNREEAEGPIFGFAASIGFVLPRLILLRYEPLSACSNPGILWNGDHEPTERVNRVLGGFNRIRHFGGSP
jgi:hypothetical protein